MSAGRTSTQPPAGRPTGRAVDRPEVGVRLIVGYKIGKAIVQAALVATLPVLRRLGVTARLQALTSDLAEHVVHGWTAGLARLLAALLAPNHLTLISLVLGVDAALSAVEAWALHRRLRWAPWLIVIASGALIPFEIYEIARRARAGRVAALVVNVAIIAYLIRRARREQRGDDEREGSA
jgi:uncharacterized membrane protein (DUF2068 family)